MKAFILFLIGLVILGLVNVNVFTPAECRASWWDIKHTEQCQKYRLP